MPGSILYESHLEDAAHCTLVVDCMIIGLPREFCVPSHPLFFLAILYCSTWISAAIRSPGWCRLTLLLMQKLPIIVTCPIKTKPMSPTSWSDQWDEITIIEVCFDGYPGWQLAKCVHAGSTAQQEAEIPAPWKAVDKYKTCPNPGMLACSTCKLVSYCSKVCNTQHQSLLASESNSDIVEMSDCSLAYSNR
jgi:hypothetical protein